MILTRRAALNGVYLDEAHEQIVIQGIEIADGRDSINAVASAAGNGQRITGMRRDSLDVSIRFGIDIKRTELEARAEALEIANTWAATATNGAYLTLSHKPGRRLFVRLAQAPGEGNLWEWTNDFTITLRAYEIPYWEDESERNAVIGAVSTSTTGSFAIEGNAPTVAGVEMLNMSGAEIKRINAITVNGSTMGFQNLGLLAGEVLVIDHATSGLLRIRIRDTGGAYRSAMSKRTPASDDDFNISPGTIPAGFTSERACKMTAFWRCRYL